MPLILDFFSLMGQLQLTLMEVIFPPLMADSVIVLFLYKLP